MYQDPSWGNANEVIEEAVRITSTDRQDQYAPPEDNFARIALVFSGILGAKLNENLTAADVARCMVGMKMVRDAHKPKRDNRDDGVGYILCLERAEPTEKD